MSRRSWLVLMVLFVSFLYAPQAEAGIPGLGRIFRWLGKTTRAKNVVKHGKKVLPAAAKMGAKTLPAAGKSLTKASVARSMAKVAPKNILKKARPLPVIETGAAVSLVVVSNGVANAIEQSASQTAGAFSDTLTGKASSTMEIIEKGSKVADSFLHRLVFYLFLFVVLFAVILFWRFDMMPWHKSGAKETERPKTAANKSFASDKQDVVDAEIVEKIEK